MISILCLTTFHSSCNGNPNNIITDTISSKKSSTIKRDVHENIQIIAKPYPFLIDFSRTAIIVVDMENDFGSDGGMFDRAGIDISMIKKVIVPTAKVLETGRKAGINTIYLKMGYHNDLSDLGSEESVNRVRHLTIMHVGDALIAPDGSKSRILIRDTWNTSIVPELKPQPGDIVLYNTRFSGFYQTSLDSILKKHHIKNLIFTGCTTSICVESTMRDATFRDYLPIVLEDFTAEPIGYNFARSNHEANQKLQ
jgi:ureidoacrylate peracid hydrolase